MSFRPAHFHPTLTRVLSFILLAAIAGRLLLIKNGQPAGNGKWVGVAPAMGKTGKEEDEQQEEAIEEEKAAPPHGIARRTHRMSILISLHNYVRHPDPALSHPGGFSLTATQIYNNSFQL